MKKTPHRILKTVLTVIATGLAWGALTGASAAESLNIFCWSEYIPQDVIKKFETTTGIKVSVENYASNEEMLSKLGGGGAYDLIQPSEYTVEALIKAKLLVPLDLAKIPNLKNIEPKYLNLPFDPGNKFTVPWMVGSVGIIVNTAKVKDDIQGWKDVFQPKFKKRIVVLDDARELTTAALSSLGIPCNDITDANLEKARGVLKNWLPLVKVYDSDSPKKAMLDGDTDLGLVWSGEGAILQREDKKFKWIIPAGDSHQFVDSLCIPKTVKNKDAAEKFMNFILQPEVSAMVSAAFPYTNPNAEARKLLTPAELANTASYPPTDPSQKLTLFKDIGKKASDIDAMVTDLRAK